MDRGPTWPDPVRVAELRRASLERAGYRPEHAGDLAARSELTLEDALRPVRAGFPPDVAYELLASGERPVF